MELWLLFLLFIAYQIYKSFFKIGATQAKEGQRAVPSSGNATSFNKAPGEPVFEAKKSGMFSSFNLDDDLTRYISTLKKKPVSRGYSPAASKPGVSQPSPLGKGDPFTTFRDAPRRDRLHRDDDVGKINLFEVRGGLFR